jgi:hypothetical protein
MLSLIRLILGVQLYLTNVIIVQLVLTLHQALALLMQVLKETRVHTMKKGGVQGIISCAPHPEAAQLTKGIA